CTRCRSATPRRGSRHCASAAAWVSRCASSVNGPRYSAAERAAARSAVFVLKYDSMRSATPSRPIHPREDEMARVAVVTGGTRGIGAAISKALKAAGYKVAANYGGNDEVAQKFKAETGIPVYKWDVGSFDACDAGLKQIESDLGPVEILVNNAGITRDGMFHRMTPENWGAVINTNLNSLFNMCRPVIEGM